MSTSLLYHDFGVRGYEYCGTKYSGGEVTISVAQPRRSYRCPVCGSDDVILRGQAPRRFRAGVIGSKRVYLDFAVPRVGCRHCGAVRQHSQSVCRPRTR